MRYSFIEKPKKQDNFFPGYVNINTVYNNSFPIADQNTKYGIWRQYHD